LGLEPLHCAEGIIRVANAEMVRALRVVTVERGIDPRGYALLAFGGAGGLHAAAIADELGIERIVCPRASGVLAALGLVVSPRRRDAQRSVFLTGEGLTTEAVAEQAAQLGEQARGELRDDSAQLRAVYELRYRGQAFELGVGAGLEPSLEQLRDGFEDLHEERYGYRDPDQDLELVTIRVTATVAGADVQLAAVSGDEEHRDRRPARLGGEEVELEVVRGTLAPGTEIEGPAVIELPESTLLLTADWSATVDEQGTIDCRRR
ncbi:MAG TPA: hydantoinase/oxoprolinase family protein, partial [Solirubrobacteraceae bacterium]